MESQVKAIQHLIDEGALFVINHSGGKDSQAMTVIVRTLVPDDQLLVVHAELGDVEWDGCEELIRKTTAGLPLIVCKSVTDFWTMVDRRRMFPSPSNRQCTSDLKRGPIEREVRRYLKANPQFNGLIVNCMGLRAEESSSRAKLETLKVSARNSKAGRNWYEWLPIHDMSETTVFATIAQAGQEAHWVYAAGMRRKSCAFCIMACDSDLKRAAELRPKLYARYVAKERELGFTLSMSRRSLPEITGIAA
ncbi:phosphoadenosine phosphosulfate reductase domain-containing protein [Croceicoccus naphthovorans]|uniref:phosphoadenosine phosphosulfate reductase domain-containing protein n=1 Tax=Croceicoccus naphthovorans TaxID=1348774 RepID=UPI00069D0A04|nr:phosphoadenosine phosphosulfate reductase family protein [Croceicoccus naphthovorans]MBB3991293.1 3'-phosphoadenosine 5'-phosphosulfate sulfotransferase (PAPS reductase)/FAD synthetase [Croceicoccus naphthovorans]